MNTREQIADIAKVRLDHYRLERDYLQALDQLTIVQARCSELENERRVLRLALRLAVEHGKRFVQLPSGAFASGLDAEVAEYLRRAREDLSR